MGLNLEEAKREAIGNHWELSSNPLISKRIQVMGVLYVRILLFVSNCMIYVELFEYCSFLVVFLGFWKNSRNRLAGCF